MDFLKYLDVFIGLAVVMILLSPAVTAFTQLFMFVSNSRSKFLHTGLVSLIRQLDGTLLEKWRVTTPAGAAVDNPRITDVGRSGNTLTVLVTDAAGNALPGHPVFLDL